MEKEKDQEVQATIQESQKSTSIKKPRKKRYKREPDFFCLNCKVGWYSDIDGRVVRVCYCGISTDISLVIDPSP